MSMSMTDEAKMKFVLSQLTPDSYKLGAGRRDWIAYRDLGIAAATQGKLSAFCAQVQSAKPMTTGWHYHTCDFLLAYYLSGWIDVYFESGKLTRLEAGSCIFIPKGMPHNEVGCSDDMSLIEFFSGEMGTVNCDEPPPGQTWT